VELATANCTSPVLTVAYAFAPITAAVMAYVLKLGCANVILTTVGYHAPKEHAPMSAVVMVNARLSSSANARKVLVVSIALRSFAQTIATARACVRLKLANVSA
jgi:hypothetical protein